MAKVKPEIKEIDPIEWVEMDKASKKIPHTVYHGFEISELPPKGASKVLDRLIETGFVIYEFDVANHLVAQGKNLRRWLLWRHL